MSATLTKEISGLKKQESKLKKLIKAIRKLFVKEFLVAICILVISIPLAITMTYFLGKLADEKFLEAFQKLLKGNSPVIGCYVISVLGIYFSRSVVAALKTLTKKQEK